MADASQSERTDLALAVLMPVYNDWASAKQVLGRLDQVLAKRPEVHADVYLVDDGSEQAPGDLVVGLELKALDSVRVIHLRRNLGHQRAIAVGLTHLHEQTSCDAVLVLDADGEDRPEDVPLLLDALAESGRKDVVFAARWRRTEGLTFRLGYLGYRLLHRILVGSMTRVGNFSLLPRCQLRRLTVSAELWGHYAATVFQAKLPNRSVEIARGHRLQGRSHMNFVSLVVHGLRAITVYGEHVVVRILVAASALGGLGLLGTCAGAWLMVARPELAPSWTPVACALALVLLIQLGASAFLLAFQVLSNRTGSSFLPVRDYAFFVDSVADLTGRE